MGGMMAARALSEHFKRVTLIDRDKNPRLPSPRKGVPQGRHVHVLLDSGKDVMDEFFPGLLKGTKGVHIIDTARDFLWRHLGVWKSRYTSGMQIVLCTRYFLEYAVRKRLEKVHNVKFQMETGVEKYLVDETRTRITGVQIRGMFGRIRDIHADLVVDASGRGSHTPRLLKELGYTEPRKEEYGIDLAYTSRLYKPPKTFKNEWDFLVLYPRPPHQKRAGFISRVEKGRWIVSLNGYHKDHAPLDEKGFLEFAKSLPGPEIYAYLKDAKPIGEISKHMVPTTRRYYYEKLARFPEGLVVIGDAICALNPIFGQGMSVASLEAKELGKVVGKLRAENKPDLNGLSREFFRRAGSIVNLPWFLTTTEDLRYPETTGPAPIAVGFLNWYKANLVELTSTNSKINQEMWKVIHLHDGLDTVLKPSVALPVLLHGLKGLFVPLEKRAHTDKMPELRPEPPLPTPRP